MSVPFPLARPRPDSVRSAFSHGSIVSCALYALEKQGPRLTYPPPIPGGLQILIDDLCHDWTIPFRWDGVTQGALDSHHERAGDSGGPFPSRAFCSARSGTL